MRLKRPGRWRRILRNTPEITRAPSLFAPNASASGLFLRGCSTAVPSFPTPVPTEVVEEFDEPLGLRTSGGGQESPPPWGIRSSLPWPRKVSPPRRFHAWSRLIFRNPTASRTTPTKRRNKRGSVRPLAKESPPPPSEVPDPAAHGRGPTLAGGVDPGAVPRSTRFFAPGTLSSPRPLPPLSPRTVRLHFESPSPGRWLALALRCLHRGSGSPLFAGLPPEPMRLPRRPHRETPAMGGADRVNPREVGEAENSCCL